MEKVLMVFGVLFLIIAGAMIVKTIKQHKTAKLGTLYFKDGAFGSRTFHLALDVDLEKIKNGEKYIVTVKEEKLSEIEVKAINEIEND